MSVIAMIEFETPASNMEDVARRDTQHRLAKLADIGRSKGAIHHQFLEKEGGGVVAIDEWESEQAFHDFFDNQGDIKDLMAEAKVAAPPKVSFFRIMPLEDRF